MLFSFETFCLIGLIIWLGMETVWDLWKSMIIPMWMVLPPLIAGGLLQLLTGGWLVAAGMTLAVLLHLSGNLWIRLIGTILVSGAAALSGMIFPAVGFVLYWLLWEVNILGGADGIGAYAALLLFPVPAMFWALIAGIFIWAAGSMVVFYRGRLFERWREFTIRIWFRNLPTESELESEGKPTIGGIWFGVLIFAAGRFTGGW